MHRRNRTLQYPTPRASIPPIPQDDLMANHIGTAYFTGRVLSCLHVLIVNHFANLILIHSQFIILTIAFMLSRASSQAEVHFREARL